MGEPWLFIYYRGQYVLSISNTFDVNNSFDTMVTLSHFSFVFFSVVAHMFVKECYVGLDAIILNDKNEKIK